MRIQEKILLKFSKDPATVTQERELQPQVEWNVNNALQILLKVFPNFLSELPGKKVVDFGCGWGYQSIALAKNGVRFVLGVEMNPKRLECARQLAAGHHVSSSVQFTDLLTPQYRGAFDIVISQNSMEHFPEPQKTLESMASVLQPQGKLFLTFGPPWLAPYGSHMQFFTGVPWVNVIFSEKTVMNVRKNFRNDGAIRYEDVESGLNKMTIAKFEKIIDQSGLMMSYKNYDCVKALNFLEKVPYIREFFINQVNCILVKKHVHD